MRSRWVSGCSSADCSDTSATSTTSGMATSSTASTQRLLPSRSRICTPHPTAKERVMSTCDQRVSDQKRRVLILGSGFAGLYAALRFEKRLRETDDVEVTLINRENY